MQVQDRNGNLDARGKARVQTDFTGEESLTVQSHADKADITKILKKYHQVGIVDHLNYAEGQYRDITEFSDFADAMRHAATAEQEFMRLPSKVREIFNHDHLEWLDSAHDPEKRQALVEAGIIASSDSPTPLDNRGNADGPPNPPTQAEGQTEPSE